MDFSAIFSFFDSIWQFLTVGIYDMLMSFGVWIIAKCVIAYWQFKLHFIELSYDVCSGVIADLNLSAVLNQAFASVDSKLLWFSTYCRIPESFNAILSALLTRFVIRFIGI